MRLSPLLCLLTMAAMCGKPGDDSSTPDDSVAPAFEPRGGHWMVTAPTVTSDGCGFFEEDTGTTGEESGVTLTMSSETEFTLLMDEDADGNSFSTTCTLTDHSFSCASFDRATFDYAPRFEAVLTVAQVISGVFSDETHFAATSLLTGTCEGAGCPDVAAQIGTTLPCEVVLENTGSIDP